MLHKLPLYVLSGIGALVMAAAGVNPGDAATNLSGWAETLSLTSAADWIAGNISDTWVAAIAAVVVGFSVARWWPTKRKTEAIQPSNESSTVEEIANAWWAICDIDPANTLIILSAGIERSRLQGNHPAWEIFFTAYNGGVGEVRLVSAGGSFKVSGQAYPTPAELKSATSAKHGEITLFTVRQWIDQQDVPQEKNHVVLQLSDLRIEAIAADPVSGNERQFVVSLPAHLQFDVRHHWNIQPDYFSWFHRERLGTDDNRAAQTAFSGPHSTRDRSTEVEAAEEPEFLDLKEAASIAFDKLRDASGTKNSIVLGVTMRLEKMDQSKIPRQVCEILFNGTKIPLHGIYPPSKVLREIPREHAESFMFSDDASELFNQYNPLERYHSVAVKESDFEQRLKELT